MIEIHLGHVNEVTVTYEVEDNYYSISSNGINICNFYLDKDKLPYNSCLCFINQDGSSSYISFEKKFICLVHNEMKELEYTNKGITTAFNTLGINIQREM